MKSIGNQLERNRETIIELAKAQADYRIKMVKAEADYMRARAQFVRYAPDSGSR